MIMSTILSMYPEACMNSIGFKGAAGVAMPGFVYNFKILRSLKSISREKYDEKISASLVYGFLSAVAVNFFFQPGHVYSSEATGLAQVITALSTRFLVLPFRFL